jgi:hypothetical protein
MDETYEIAQAQWVNFLRLISRQSAGKPIRVEVENRELGDQQLATLLPLRSLALERKGSERGDLVILAGTDEDEASHRINAPTRMYLLQNQAGENVCLCVEDAEGGKTLLYFEHLLELPPPEPQAATPSA